MLKLKLSVVFILFLTSFSFAQQADKIIGEYRLPNKLDVEIFKSREKYYGRIIALNGFEEGEKKDVKNPDKSKRKDVLVGQVIINNLEFDEDSKEWLNGTMYGPEKGMIFDLKVTEVKEDEIEVCGSKYFIRKSMSWKKL